MSAYDAQDAGAEEAIAEMLAEQEEQDAELAAEVNAESDPDAAAEVAEREERRRTHIRKPKPHERKRAVRETPAAAAAFARYREMPPTLRSLRNLAALMVDDEVRSGQPLRTDRDRRVRNLSNQLFEWSSLHEWRRRVMEWDAEQAENKRLARESAMDEMNDRQSTLAQGIGNKVWVNIADMLDADTEALLRYRAEVARQPSGTLKMPKHPALFFGPHALVNLGKILVDTERIAKGAATAAVQQQHTGQVEMTIAVKRAATNLSAAAGVMRETPLGADMPEIPLPEFPFAGNVALAGDGPPGVGVAVEETPDGPTVVEALPSLPPPPFAGLLPPAANDE